MQDIYFFFLLPLYHKLYRFFYLSLDLFGKYCNLPILLIYLYHHGGGADECHRAG